MAIITGYNNKATAIMESKTTTGAGTTYQMPAGPATFMAVGTTSSGSGSATVTIQVSNGGEVWLTAGTITLTLSTSAAGDGFAVDAPWGSVRANVTAISGTGASVNVYMGV